MIGRATAFAALFGLAATPVLSRPLDPLLEGFDEACAYTDALGALLQSSYAFARKEGKVEIPAGYEASFGTPSVKPVEDYLQITLPVLDGTWRGVPIKEIEAFITPLESGFSSHAIVFPTEALEDAQAAFKDRGIAAQKELTATDENDFGWQTGFIVTDGVPRYECDLST